MAGKSRVWAVSTVRSRCYIEPEDDGCWLWLQAVSNCGKTPLASIGGRPTLVARWLMQHLGHDVAGRCVWQTCEQKLCLNPAHLALREKGDALRQAYAVGARSKPAEYAGKLRTAQSSGLAKLNMPKAIEIRRRLRDEGATVCGLAAEHGLAQSTISAVKLGRTWRSAAPESSVFARGSS